VENNDSAGTSLVRRHDFDCDGPIDIWVEIGGGRLEITLEESSAGAAAVGVQVRPDPAGQPWGIGFAGLLGWLGHPVGAVPHGELGTQAVRRTLVEFTGRRLTVHTPREFPLHTVPVIIQVRAPAGSSITARSGAADVVITGDAATLHIMSGSGEVRAQQCTGDMEIRTGSGDVRVGTVQGRLRVRTGSGTVDVSSLQGSGKSVVKTGSGNVRLGAVKHDISARTGSGDLTVADACAGGLDLTTGSGQLRVGIHAGVRAELDVSSGCGNARSDLPLSGPPTEGEVQLRVRARTGSGDALVTSASS
jgi:hypothetical protein